VAYRHNEAANSTRTSNNNGLTLTCGCARKIRASKTVAAAGPINCGLCDNHSKPKTRRMMMTGSRSDRATAPRAERATYGPQ
jgi:hypothetical protein